MLIRIPLSLSLSLSLYVYVCVYVYVYVCVCVVITQLFYRVRFFFHVHVWVCCVGDAAMTRPLTGAPPHPPPEPRSAASVCVLCVCVLCACVRARVFIIQQLNHGTLNLNQRLQQSRDGLEMRRQAQVRGWWGVMLAVNAKLNEPTLNERRRMLWVVGCDASWCDARSVSC